MSDDKKQITEEEYLDRILKYLVDNRSDLPIDADQIWKNVFPNQNQQIAYILIKKLLHKSDIVISHIRDENLNNFEVFIEATDFAEVFLKQGGFQGELAKQQKAKTEKDRIDDLNNRKLQAEIDVIEFQKGLGKKLTVWGFVIGVVSVLASVITTMIQNNGDSTETIDSIVVKTDSLLKRVTEIERTLIEKSDTTIKK
jgi:hypothetical protein